MHSAQVTRLKISRILEPTRIILLTDVDPKSKIDSVRQTDAQTDQCTYENYDVSGENPPRAGY